MQTKCHCDVCTGDFCWKDDADIQGQVLQDLENMTERAYEELGYDTEFVLDYMSDANLEIDEMHMLMDWLCPDCLVNLMKSGMCPACLADYSNFIGG